MLEAPGLPQYGIGPTPGIDIERTLQYAMDRGDAKQVQSINQLIAFERMRREANSESFQQNLAVYQIAENQAKLGRDLAEKADLRVATVAAIKALNGKEFDPADISKSPDIALEVEKLRFQQRAEERRLGIAAGNARAAAEEDHKWDLRMKAIEYGPAFETANEVSDIDDPIARLDYWADHPQTIKNFNRTKGFESVVRGLYHKPPAGTATDAYAQLWAAPELQFDVNDRDGLRHGGEAMNAVIKAYDDELVRVRTPPSNTLTPDQLADTLRMQPIKERLLNKSKALFIKSHADFIHAAGLDTLAGSLGIEVPPEKPPYKVGLRTFIGTHSIFSPLAAVAIAKDVVKTVKGKKLASGKGKAAEPLGRKPISRVKYDVAVAAKEKELGEGKGEAAVDAWIEANGYTVAP
jgi:hypothetical protein